MLEFALEFQMIQGINIGLEWRYEHSFWVIDLGILRLILHYRPAE